MKQLFSIIVLITFQFAAFCQDLTINCNLQNGSIERFYLINGLTVTEISESGEILGFLVFDSIISATSYINRPKDINKPAQSLNLSGVEIYFESYTSMEYYSPKEYNSGKIKQIGDVSFKYYNTKEYNSGKVKEIGNTPITYYTKNEYNSSNVKSIGLVNLNYYNDNEYNSGKLKQVGKIQIEYYTPNEYNSGKFKSMTGVDTRLRLLNHI